LPVRVERAGGEEFAEHGAVVLRRLVRRLAADHRDVVVEAEVTDAVVLAQQRALRGQFMREIRRLRILAERRLEQLVLEHDDEDVVDLRRGFRRVLRLCGNAAAGEQRRSQDERSTCAHDALHKAMRRRRCAACAKRIKPSADSACSDRVRTA
jgi:hypothetical protein